MDVFWNIRSLELEPGRFPERYRQVVNSLAAHNTFFLSILVELGATGFAIFLTLTAMMFTVPEIRATGTRVVGGDVNDLGRGRFRMTWEVSKPHVVWAGHCGCGSFRSACVRA